MNTKARKAAALTLDAVATTGQQAPAPQAHDGGASAGGGRPATLPTRGARVGDGHWIEQVNPRFSVKQQGRPMCLCWGRMGTNTGWGSAEGKFGCSQSEFPLVQYPIRLTKKKNSHHRHEICREKKLARASSLRASTACRTRGSDSSQRPS